MNSLIKKINNQGVKLTVENNNLKLNYKGILPEDLINEIKKNKGDLINYLNKYSINDSFKEIIPVDNQESYDLSRAQLRVWLLSQFEESNRAYNMFNHNLFNDKPNLAILKKAFLKVIERYEILRTNFFIDKNGDVKQKIIPFSSFNLKIGYIDKYNSSIEKVIGEKLFHSFDLKNENLIRIYLIKGKGNSHYLVLVIHHIICDGVSFRIIYDELLKYYNSFLNNNQLELPPVKIQYKDYVNWEKKVAEEDNFLVSKKFWIELFSGELPTLNFPADKKRPFHKTYNGCELRKNIRKDIFHNYKSILNKSGSSLFNGIFTLINILIFKYTNQNDIIVGTPVSCRNHVELENQIGLFINTLALRTQFSKDISFLSFLNKSKKNTLEAFTHNLYPFDQLIEDLELKNELSRNPLFDILINLQNSSLDYEFQDEVGGSVSQFDLSFDFLALNDTLHLKLIYNTDLYNRSTMERMLSHVENLLESITKEPTSLISDLTYIGEDEQHLLLDEFNATEAKYPKEKTIVDLFEDQVANTPRAIALVYEGEEMSYEELNWKSNQLARYLCSNYRIERDTLIGINMDRSLDMIVSILGVLKSGGAYVPIDPETPQNRVDFINDDCSFQLIINNEFIKEYKEKKEAYPLTNLNIDIKNSDLIYVIYTSGSTGKPKGVANEHRGVVNRLEWMWKEYNFTSLDVILQKTTYTFDVSVWELFMPLCWGCKMVLCNKDDIYSPTRLLSIISKEGVSCLHFVPSMLKAFNADIEVSDKESLKTLRCVVTSGEELPLGLVADWYKKFEIPIYNLYGPTEASVDVTYYNTSKDDIIIPIGKPIANTQLYILGESLVLQPIGIIGELYIGGDGLARGYLNRPELTSEKFIENPFQEGERLYKTGDLGRWLPDGNIEFIGRKDSQVKLRGYRIELGEIEHVLQGYTQVSSCCVVIKESSIGDKDLVAYYLGEEGLRVQDLRAYLEESLPSYMVPSYFVPLEVMPLTSNGKLDRKSLPNPEGLGIATGIEYVAPSNKIEEDLVSIWSDVLGISEEAISVTANFFELGGHSLKVLKLSSRLYKDLGTRVSVQDLFTHSSISSQSIFISESEKEAYQEIPKAEKSKSYVLSSSQRRLWFLSQFESANVAYNMPNVYELNFLDKDLLEASFNILIARHESLRTVFKENDEGEVSQFILEELSFKLEYEDLEGISTLDLKSRIVGYSNSPFDLSEGPLLRGFLSRLSKDQYVFVYVMHHIISDGVSMDTLYGELLSIYTSIEKGVSLELAPLRIQYKDYAVWQQSALQSGTLSVSRDYWLEEFRGELPILDLPIDYVRPITRSYKGGMVTRIFNKDSLSKFKFLLNSEEGLTSFMGVLSLVNVLLYKYTGSKDIILGSPISGRNHPDLEGQIGFYVNTLAFRTGIESTSIFKELLLGVKHICLEGYNHQAYPFDSLVDELPLSRDTSRHPLFDVMVTYQGSDVEESDIEESSNLEDERSIGMSHVISKFDLTFNFVEQDGVLRLGIEYSSDLFKESTVTRMLGHVENLLTSIVSIPTLPLKDLAYIGDAERDLLLYNFNNTKVDYPSEKTIVDLFEDQVANTPRGIALVYEGEEMSYEELNEQSNQLAGYLCSNYRIERDTLIGIKMDRSLDVIVSILGVLKSGGAYVPIDSEYPKSRIDYMMSDSGCELLLDRLEYSNFEESQKEYTKDNLGVSISNDDLAYVIYTSGSTGEPKGVMIEHRGILNTIISQNEEFELKKHQRSLQFASYSFDASVSEIFISLTSGVTMYMVGDKERQDPKLLESFIIDKSIEIATIPPSFLKLMNVDSLKPLMTLITAGESAVYDKAIEFSNKGAYYNAYGPTESSICATTYRLQEGDVLKTEIIPIGTPISNSTLFILDSQLSLCSIGIVGEICLGGDGLARGYLNRPELTSEKFIENPFQEGERLYKTGDLGRWLPDGNIEFIGRKDSQVKLRGYRIELGEIEHVLQGYTQVSSCCVVIKESSIGDKDLVAYYLGEEGLRVQDLRAYLEESLPSYMVPSYFVPLEVMPLTSNGKLDRKSLPNPEGLGISTGIEYVAPKNKEEEQLVDIWSEILGLPEGDISTIANFFELGGNSIKILRLQKMINKVFNSNIEVAVLFKYYSIENQAKMIKTDLYKDYDLEDTIEDSIAGIEKKIELFNL